MADQSVTEHVQVPLQLWEDLLSILDQCLDTAVIVDDADTTAGSHTSRSATHPPSSAHGLPAGSSTVAAADTGNAALDSVSPDLPSDSASQGE